MGNNLGDVDPVLGAVGTGEVLEEDVHAGCSGINGEGLDAGQGIALDEVHSAPGQRLKPKVQIQSCRSHVL